MGTSAAARKSPPGIAANRSASRARKRSLSESGSGKASLGSAWICRICHGDEGWLVAPCSCRGTVAWVHRACLERWLSEAGRDSCELCGRRFHTVRVPRHGPWSGLLRWLATGLDARQANT
ncbi:E3 ubiquitin-protein ligase MARCHF3-like [Schistocerca gregaria]|uniref:E3 ubiquitin-protein ligase MARCHF3-like n=1 Tax=Schistocerca gregaria TaxID=7010 RepID=UPI00211E75AC|nr:E3 ubiquitin-protein ligase MARCHF3-like [Schistocerca gregaria]